MAVSGLDVSDYEMSEIEFDDEKNNRGKLRAF
jgi:hypothetical protein